ncbi:hypothetical protein K227x_56670 [Rubripirellula lacrimiformis]|uniref:Uncharacterized protein n=1 Tax=Rubripirellula lacrimiformis TaxID=1930273 RepID=A0A517NJC8_9BACT|nr:hypothetical protein K227x_56670 [Rubripirellula lacrimiformis]
MILWEATILTGSLADVGHIVILNESGLDERKGRARKGDASSFQIRVEYESGILGVGNWLPAIQEVR